MENMKNEINTFEIWNKISRGQIVDYDLEKFTDDELDELYTNIVDEMEGHKEGSKMYVYLDDVYHDVENERSARKNAKWEIFIDYTWGDEEPPVGDFNSKEEAFKEACSLAGMEAYVQNEEFSPENTASIFVDAANLSIDLTYGNGETCRYRVRRKKEVAA